MDNGDRIRHAQIVADLFLQIFKRVPCFGEYDELAAMTLRIPEHVVLEDSAQFNPFGVLVRMENALRETFQAFQGFQFGVQFASG